VINNPLNPKPGYEALRKHRWSASGAEYFITFKTQQGGLVSAPVLEFLNGQREQLMREGYWRVRTWCVMPDHIHVLFALGVMADLARCLRLFKGRLSPALRANNARWQEGYYEHRMREEEDRLPVFLYIFLNPYRANLLPVADVWPGYFCSSEDWDWSGTRTNSSTASPEWLQ
jgi:putative transposase